MAIVFEIRAECGDAEAARRLAAHSAASQYALLDDRPTDAPCPRTVVTDCGRCSFKIAVEAKNEGCRFDGEKMGAIIG